VKLSAPDIALAFIRRLWHKTAVLVWLERFVLTVLAATLMGVVVFNSMKLDAVQRWTLGIAILALSYFAAHTVHKQRSEPTPPQAEQTTALTLKGLFLTDFGPELNRARWDNRTLTIGSKTNKVPEVTLTFTPQLWIDFHEGTEFLGFYIPVQDKDPDEASAKTVRLCKYLPEQFPEILKMLQSLEVTKPNSRGSTVRSADLPLSRRVYVYHEDFISPPDLGDLVREFEARQWVIEFRGRDYLATQELLRRK
jgi:hypothetical protein